jgi:hypothetical protein
LAGGRGIFIQPPSLIAIIFNWGKQFGSSLVLSPAAVSFGTSFSIGMAVSLLSEKENSVPSVSWPG